MNIAQCLKTALELKEISPDEAVALQAEFDAAARARGAGSGAFDAERLAKADVVLRRQLDSKRKKRVALLTATAKIRVDAIMDGFVTSGGKVREGEAAISLIEHYGISGAEGFSTVVGRSKAILGRAQAEVEDVINHFMRTKILGKTPNRADLYNLVREAFGEDTGDATAKKMFQAWEKVAEDLRQRRNRAGGHTAKRSRWGLPQTHDRLALIKGKTAWRTFLMDNLDLTKMRNPKTGGPLTAADLPAYLDAVYEEIVSEGWASREAQGHSGASSLANQRAEHRELVFKSADVWLKYAEDFGSGNPYATMMGHLNSMSKDIAAMELLGPNPDNMVRYLINRVTKKVSGSTDGHVRSLAARDKATLETMWKMERGHDQNPELNTFGTTAAVARNVITGSVLGTAIASAMPTDPIFQMFARYMAGLPVMSTLFDIVKGMSKGNRRLAVRTGLILDTATHMQNDHARYVGTLSGPGWSAALPDRVLSLTGLTAWTQTTKHVFGMEFWGAFADQSHKAWGDLSGGKGGRFQRTMLRYGISADDWEKIRSVPIHDPSGINIISPEQVGKVYPDLAEKMLEMVLQETEYATPSGTLRGRAFLTGNERRGSFFGVVRSSFSMFKSFPVTFMMLHNSRLAMLWSEGKASAIGYAAALAASMTIGGMLSIWLKDVAAGRDPRPITDEEGSPLSFISQAFMQGGGLGILGDFAVANVNRYGGGISETLAGPLIGQANNLRNLTIGNLAQLASGETTNFWKELQDFTLRNIPGSTAWYIRAAYQRVLVDNLSRLTDPNADASFRRQAQYWQDNYGTDLWWAPGQNTPSRGPNFNLLHPAR
tara:strand:+ start:12430 stop:14916 length:2487 start_codon:yes stop_codon:yes gene_type:complete